MKPRLQTTLSKPVSLSGVGVHSGLEASLIVHPSKDNAGIVFRRVDLIEEGAGADQATIAARPEAVSAVQLGTTIRNAHGASVSTIEHLMAALAITGVDNAVIEVRGSELPILDGSAAPFVQALDEAGVTPLTAPLAPFVLTAPLEEKLEDRFIRFEPSGERRLEIMIAFDDPAIGVQRLSLDLDDTAQLRQRMAPARTFCLLHQVEAMKAAGLGLGGSLDNAIVVDQGEILNEGELRDPAEFVLHKALDLLGDLHLLGAPLQGRITAHKPGHDLNTRFAQAVARAVGDAAPHRGRVSGAAPLSA